MSEEQVTAKTAEDVRYIKSQMEEFARITPGQGTAENGGDIKSQVAESLKSRLRTMNLQDADVLLVRGHGLAGMISQLKLPWLKKDKHIQIIVVDDVNMDLKTLDEAAMKAAGWVREKKSSLVLVP